MQAPNRVGSSDREKELERRVESLQQQLERALAENERSSDLRNSNGESSPCSSNWSARWRRTSACGSNWNKRCELTSEAPHRFPRGNPKVTLSRRDASLARHTGSGPPDRFPAGWMSKSPYRSRRTAHTVTVR